MGKIQEGLKGQKVYKLEIGDTVRIAKTKLQFEKGYESNWSEELFTISGRLPRTPPVYKVKDLLGEEIDGTFYLQELQRVKPVDSYPIDKICKKRKRRGQVEYFVKFKGYPNKFNTWIPSHDLYKLGDP